MSPDGVTRNQIELQMDRHRFRPFFWLELSLSKNLKQEPNVKVRKEEYLLRRN